MGIPKCLLLGHPIVGVFGARPLQEHVQSRWWAGRCSDGGWLCGIGDGGASSEWTGFGGPSPSVVAGGVSCRCTGVLLADCLSHLFVSGLGEVLFALAVPALVLRLLIQ